MTFEKYDPRAGGRGPSRRPARVTFDIQPNRRTQVRLSASLRDWLQLVSYTKDAEEQNRIEILVDRGAGALMLRRVAPGADTAPEQIVVRGLSGGTSAYFALGDVEAELGVVRGRYDVELIHDQELPAAVMSIGSPLDGPTEPPPLDEQAAQIRAVLDEGLDTVNGEAPSPPPSREDL